MIDLTLEQVEKCQYGVGGYAVDLSYIAEDVIESLTTEQIKQLCADNGVYVIDTDKFIPVFQLALDMLRNNPYPYADTRWQYIENGIDLFIRAYLPQPSSGNKNND